MRQKTAINTGNIARPSEGLGNHCSIRLSYGANGGFPRFPPRMLQGQTRKRRKGGLGVATQEVAQSVLETFRDNPQPRDGNAVAWGTVVGCWLPWYTDKGFEAALNLDTYKWHKAPRADNGPPLSDEDLIALAHKMADESDTFAKCYFIGGDEGPVKIGYSVNPSSRLKALQLASPVRLRVLATAGGGIYREAAYHGQFEAHRLHGEWFARAPEIEAEIERLTMEVTNV